MPETWQNMTMKVFTPYIPLTTTTTTLAPTTTTTTEAPTTTTTTTVEPTTTTTTAEAPPPVTYDINWNVTIDNNSGCTGLTSFLIYNNTTAVSAVTLTNITGSTSDTFVVNENDILFIKINNGECLLGEILIDSVVEVDTGGVGETTFTTNPITSNITISGLVY